MCWRITILQEYTVQMIQIGSGQIHGLTELMLVIIFGKVTMRTLSNGIFTGVVILIIRLLEIDSTALMRP